jgi:hypothetical protein
MQAQQRNLVAALLFAPLFTALAQSEGDLRAFAALRATHIGALTPLMTPAMVSRRLNGAQLGLRYGLLYENNLYTNAIAGTGIFATGVESSVSVTAGVTDANCNGCQPSLLLGVGGDMRLYESSELRGTGTGLTVAISGDVGYAQIKPGDDNAFALGVGAPITVSLGSSQGLRWAIYGNPVFGVGQTSTDCIFPDCDKSGIRWVLGGGIGAWSPTTNISASVGINQVVLSGAKPVYGINVVIGGR